MRWMLSTKVLPCRERYILVVAYSRQNSSAVYRGGEGGGVLTFETPDLRWEDRKAPTAVHLEYAAKYTSCMIIQDNTSSVHMLTSRRQRLTTAVAFVNLVALIPKRCSVSGHSYYDTGIHQKVANTNVCKRLYPVLPSLSLISQVLHRQQYSLTPPIHQQTNQSTKQ